MLPPGHPLVVSPRIGVLLVNLGTPDAPTPRAVRRYLKEFLSDRRVVEVPRLVWWPVLNGIVLNTRPKKSAHAYSQVWTEDGSPLAAITKAQAADLQRRLGDDVMVSHGMRYGNPALGSEIQRLKDAGCEQILVAPLYPQYSGATTATVADAVGAKLATMRWQPALRSLPPYYDDPLHIGALKAVSGQSAFSGKRAKADIVRSKLPEKPDISQGLVARAAPLAHHCVADPDSQTTIVPFPRAPSSAPRDGKRREPCQCRHVQGHVQLHRDSTFRFRLVALTP